MDPQTERHGAAISARVDPDAEQRYFGSAPLDEIRRELKHHGVNVEEITASLRVYLAQKLAALAPKPPVRRGRHDAEAMYLQSLPTIDRIAAFIARRNRLATDETEDFVSEVRIRLLEDDYAIVRKFEGRSSFATYLTTVIGRIYHRYRVALWGKWRPSKEARQLGDKAITLERLLSRDGYSFDEAANMLTVRADAGVTRAELEALSLRLPPRGPRTVLVSAEASPEAQAAESADDRLQANDRERTARAAAAVLDAVLADMSPEDQLMLRLRFWSGMTVADIARILHLEQKYLYRRMHALLERLRTALENAGVDRGVVGDLLTHPASDLRLASMPERMQQPTFGAKCPA